MLVRKADKKASLGVAVVNSGRTQIMKFWLSGRHAAAHLIAQCIHQRLMLLWRGLSGGRMLVAVM